MPPPAARLLLTASVLVLVRGYIGQNEALGYAAAVRARTCKEWVRACAYLASCLPADVFTIKAFSAVPRSCWTTDQDGLA